MLFFSSIPVLMYHHVNDFREDSITISQGNFESQIKYLKEAGYNSISLPEMFEIMYGRATPPKKPVLITFDDGYADNLVYAFPILKKYQMKAAIFVTTSLVKDSRPLPPRFDLTGKSFWRAFQPHAGLMTTSPGRRQKPWRKAAL